MKKLLFGLIATLFVINFSWGQIGSREFGKVHNELVLEYLKNNVSFDLNKVKMNDLINEFIRNFEIKYPNAISENDKKKVLEIFKNYTFASEFTYSGFLRENKDSLLKNNEISKNIYDFLSDTDSKNIDYELIKSEISNYQSIDGISSSDSFAFEVANSVANSSNDLWNSNTGSVMNRNHCNGRIIISDTGAALMWFAVPAVSLIAGACSSLITAYADGHCR